MDILHIQIGFGQFGQAFAIPVLKQLVEEKGHIYRSLVIARTDSGSGTGKGGKLRRIFEESSNEYFIRMCTDNGSKEEYGVTLDFGALYDSSDKRFEYLSGKINFDDFNQIIIATSVRTANIESAAETIIEFLKKHESLWVKPIHIIALENGKDITTRELKRKMQEKLKDIDIKKMFFYDAIVDRISILEMLSEEEKTPDGIEPKEGIVNTEDYFSLILKDDGYGNIDEIMQFGGEYRSPDKTALFVKQEEYSAWEKMKMLGLNGLHYWLCGNSLIIFGHRIGINHKLSFLGSLVEKSSHYKHFEDCAVRALERYNYFKGSERDRIRVNLQRISNESLSDDVSRVLKDLVYESKNVDISEQRDKTYHDWGTIIKIIDKIVERLEEPFRENIPSYGNTTEWFKKASNQLIGFAAPMLALKYFTSHKIMHLLFNQFQSYVINTAFDVKNLTTYLEPNKPEDRSNLSF